METGPGDRSRYFTVGLIFDAIKLNSRGILYDLERISHCYIHESLTGDFTVMARADDGTAIEIYRTPCSISANGMKQLLEELLEETKSDEDNLIVKNGIYLLRDDSGYEKTVEAVFNDGKLVRLVDKDGNNWMGWQKHVCWDEPREAHQ